MYDFLIVGAGLYGAVCACELQKLGKKCLVIEKRNHIAGNAYTEEVSGILVHRYGAHIFHTGDRQVWDYVRRFAEFNHFVNSPIAVYGEEVYNLPFNMNTFSKMWKIRSPQQAKQIIADQIAALHIENPRNLEEQALSLVGTDVYEKLIKGYTEKQWGRDCRDLPAFLIRRLPCRFTYDNNYFNDPYQGIPRDGYTPMVQKMLEGTEVLLNTDFESFIGEHPHIAERILYSGPIDGYFHNCLGALQYRSLRFETEELPIDNFQGNAVVNYTDRRVPYTRILEHKHFAFGKQKNTVISREYPAEWAPGLEPYYPINDEKNQALFEKYRALAAKEPNVIFGGRLGSYRYYDMDQVIRSALDTVSQMMEKRKG